MVRVRRGVEADGDWRPFYWNSAERRDASGKNVDLGDRRGFFHRRIGGGRVCVEFVAQGFERAEALGVGFG